MYKSLTFTSYPTTQEILPERGRQEIVETLDELNVRLGSYSEEFVIIGGANLVLRGLRDRTVDVDLLVSDATFEAMGGMPEAKIKLPPRMARERGATNHSVWLNTDWTKIPVSAATHMGEGYYPISYGMYDNVDLELIAGHAVAPLKDVWGSKVSIQRPKDLPDLELIASASGVAFDLPPRTYTGPLADS